LVIRIERFIGESKEKNNKFVSFPLEIDLSEFVISKENLLTHEKDYLLYGIELFREREV
jgi:hypothetical protein